MNQMTKGSTGNLAANKKMRSTDSYLSSAFFIGG